MDVVGLGRPSKARQEEEEEEEEEEESSRSLEELMTRLYRGRRKVGKASHFPLSEGS